MIVLVAYTSSSLTVLVSIRVTNDDTEVEISLDSKAVFVTMASCVLVMCTKMELVLISIIMEWLVKIVGLIIVVSATLSKVW